MLKKFKNKLSKILFCLSIVTIISGSLASYWYYQNNIFTGIREYNPEKDRAFILNIFDKDWYWLVAEDREHYDPKYTLDNRASSKVPENKGNLQIYVYQESGRPAGFIAFFKKNIFKGDLRFIAIDQK